MLPFATYNIPESTKHKTPDLSKWLLIVSLEKISNENEELLRKICSALKADFDKEVSFYLFTENEQPSEIILQSHQSLIMSFGVPPSSLGLWIDLNAPGIRYMESFAFILTTRIDELSKSPTAKKQLWGFMQSFLELK
jgi:hypothetical protein